MQPALLESRAKYLAMGLRDILPLLQQEELVIDSAVPSDLSEVRAGILQTDLASVRPGDIFVGYAGSGFDGNSNVFNAIVKRCSFVICEQRSALPSPCPVPWIVVSNGRSAWAHLCAHASGSPHKRLTILGVTGTNGKTSAAWMVHTLLNRMGRDSLCIGTLGAFFNRQRYAVKNTTPGPDTVFPLMAHATAKGYRYCVLEVSSHALEQSRLSPLQFKTAAFTSFSRDHLDYHKTMDDYWRAKWLLFSEHLAPDASTFLNASLSPRLPDTPGSKSYLYGNAAQRPPAANPWHDRFLQLEVQEASLAGSRISLGLPSGETVEGQIPFIGDHNAENFMAAYLMVHAVTGLSPDPALWSTLVPVPGRLESVRPDGNSDIEIPSVLVDYAHTPDGLEKTLGTVSRFCRGKLWVVFGCGGERDRGKRSEMAQVAQKHADMIVVTSDNPRSESPQQISMDILKGFDGPVSNVVVELDRAKAITLATRRSGPDDVVIIAGKGHETTQVLADSEIDFDDRIAAKKALSLL